MKKRDLRHAISFAALCAAFAAGAQAQYVWLDENGRKQYSDLPPPPSVPDRHILKRPGTTTLPASPTQAEQDKPPAPTLAERDAEFRKRRAEKAEQEKKAREEARVAAENRKRCERLREYQGALESGVRMARRKADGEREIIDDAERKRELQETRRMLAECK